MRKMNTRMLETIVGMLRQNPNGLSSVEIYNNLADSGKFYRHLPAMSSIGSVLKGMSPVGITTNSSRYERTNTSGARKVSVWTIDVDKYNQWRNKNE